jgi:hypothetical protein
VRERSKVERANVDVPSKKKTHFVRSLAQIATRTKKKISSQAPPKLRENDKRTLACKQNTNMEREREREMNGKERVGLTKARLLERQSKEKNERKQWKTDE